MGADYTLEFYEGAEPIVVEQFTDEEADILAPHITSMGSNVFGWKISDNFIPEQAGALLSRYSRTALSGKRLFLKEFYPNRNRGREFFEAWLVDYGDDSIQEMVGGLPTACEFISNLAVKEIEDCRLGSYIEKSTRYVPFDKKLPNGQYMYYIDPDIMQSKYADRYLALMNGLFTSYSGYMDKMFKYIKEVNSIDDIGFRIGTKVVKVSEINQKNEEELGVTADDLIKAYENAIRANALDFMRDYLPMATLTHVGISANARSYENLMTKMLSSPLAEARWTGVRLAEELSKLVPSLTKRVYTERTKQKSLSEEEIAKADTRVLSELKKIVPGLSEKPQVDEHGMEFQKFLTERHNNTRRLAESLTSGTLSKELSVDLMDYKGEGTLTPDVHLQISLAAAILYRFSRGASMRQLIDKVSKMSEDERKKIINTYVGNRTNRRHKPGRAFENIEYLFDLKGRIGIYRDIQRHRIGTQERQNFGIELGYDTREAYGAIGIEDDYKAKMAEVESLYKDLYATLPYQAQYVVTFGYNIRWYYRLNARQLFHLCELRTTPQGHPDYRKLVQQMALKVKDVHPTVIEQMKYLNLTSKTLGRLDSEIRIAAKKKALGVKA